MSDETLSVIIGLLVIVAPFICFGCGYHVGTVKMRKEAISHGAAYWAINPTNGTVTFTWKGSKE